MSVCIRPIRIVQDAVCAVFCCICVGFGIAAAVLWHCVQIVLFLPALCRKMGVPYCIVKSKARLGRVVHRKTATCLAFTQVNPWVLTASDGFAWHNITVIVIARTMFTVLSAYHCHSESSPGSSDECSMQHQVAANLWTKPISLSQ